MRWLIPDAQPLNHMANIQEYIMTSNENVTHALIMETGRSRSQASVQCSWLKEGHLASFYSAKSRASECLAVVTVAHCCC